MFLSFVSSVSRFRLPTVQQHIDHQQQYQWSEREHLPSPPPLPSPSLVPVFTGGACSLAHTESVLQLGGPQSDPHQQLGQLRVGPQSHCQQVTAAPGLPTHRQRHQ